jgi:hypothetical protein
MKSTLTRTKFNQVVALPQIRFTKGFSQFTVKATFDFFLTLGAARCAGFITSKR